MELDKTKKHIKESSVKENQLSLNFSQQKYVHILKEIKSEIKDMSEMLGQNIKKSKWGTALWRLKTNA